MYEFYKEIKSYFDLTKAKPKSVALGAALAAFLAFVPLKSGLVALVVFLIGMTSASGTVAALLTLVLKPLSMLVLDATSVSIGQKICESDFAKSHAGLWNAPGIALLGLEKYHVMGGAVMGLMAAVPFFIVFYRLQIVVNKVREKAVEKATALKQKRAEEKALAAGATPEAAKLAGEEAIAPKPPKQPGFFGKLLGVYYKWRKIPLKKWIALAIVLAVFELFIAKPMLRKVLKENFPDGLAKAMGMVDADGNVVQRGKVDFDDATFDFSLVRGTLHLENLQVTNPKNPTENLFQAKKIDAKVSSFALLRRQFLVESVELDTPQLAVAREADGTLGVEPKPATPVPPAAQNQDWATKAKSYFERAKKEYDERQKKKEEEKKAGEKGEKKPGDATAKKPSMLGRAGDGLPGENDDLLASRWVVQKVSLTGFTVNLQDPQNQSPSFAFNDGHILEAAQNRLANGKATVLDLVGSLVDQAKKSQGNVKLSFTADAPDLDPSKPVAWKLHAELGEVDLRETDALYADAVPLAFDQGKATLVVDASGHGLDGDLDCNPKISFKGVVARARRTTDKIAGFDATKVAEEVTNCGEFELNDIKITGCVLAPKVELGDTIKNLVVEGGKNYAKKKGTEMLNKGIDQGLQKIDKKIPGASDKADDVKKKLEGLNPFGK